MAPRTFAQHLQPPGLKPPPPPPRPATAPPKPPGQLSVGFVPVIKATKSLNAER